jgi:hypothetical protein
MLAISNGESRRVFALIEAYKDSEITTNEFTDGIGTLSAETVQFAASVLNLKSSCCCEEHPRLSTASRLCRQHAARCRARC